MDDQGLERAAKIFITDFATAKDKTPAVAADRLKGRLGQFFGKEKLTKQEASTLHKIFTTVPLRKRMMGDLRSVFARIATEAGQDAFIKEVCDSAIKANTDLKKAKVIEE